MLYQVTGDILLSRAELLAHGVAPNDHFDSGLARELRERFPAMVKDFRHYYHVHHPKPGEVWVWSGVGGTHIANLMTQEPAVGDHGHPGRATEANVNHALRNLRQEILKGEFQSVALPKLACGVGGMSWDTVATLIQHHLGDLDIPVYVYSDYQAGVEAKEPV